MRPAPSWVHNRFVDNKRTRPSSYNIAYHFVWIPKYRRPVLIGGIPKRLVEMLYSKTAELGGEILNVTVQPDHVHLFCSFPPTIAPFQIMYRLKGFTAHELRKEFPWLRSRLPACGPAPTMSEPLEMCRRQQFRSTSKRRRGLRPCCALTAFDSTQARTKPRRLPKFCACRARCTTWPWPTTKHWNENRVRSATTNRLRCGVTGEMKTRKSTRSG